MEIPVTDTLAGTPPRSSGKAGFNALTSDDFLHLMIVQLQNQDPLEPASNQELMQQLATIRNMELSSTLTNSIRTLADQQRSGSAAALIGSYVTARVPEGAAGIPPVEGLVNAIRFSERGQVVLELVGGAEMPIADIEQVAGLDSLVGQLVQFHDPAAPDGSEPLVGQVVDVAIDGAGKTVLSVDTGEAQPRTVPLRNVISFSRLRADDFVAPVSA